MKYFFKISFLFLAVSLFAASCNNSTVDNDDNDSDTTGIIDSMPEDTTASGDTAVVLD